jgi:mRNA interferase RelE/StbE
VATVVLTYVDERLADNPERVSKEFGGHVTGVCGARNGDYRILFPMGEDTLWVLRVAHRAHAYRPR